MEQRVHTLSPRLQKNDAICPSLLSAILFCLLCSACGGNEPAEEPSLDLAHTEDTTDLQVDVDISPDLIEGDPAPDGTTLDQFDLPDLPSSTDLSSDIEPDADENNGTSCGPLSAESIHFSEVTSVVGFGEHFYAGASGHSLGTCWIDYNNDNWPDIFAVNGQNHTYHLYQNTQNGVFIETTDLLPESSLFAMSASYAGVEAMGCLFADYDNDGDDDLYVLVTDNNFALYLPNELGGGYNLLFHNNWMENGEQIIEGELLFEERGEVVGLHDPGGPNDSAPGLRATSGTWMDYDLDGWLDLYVAHWNLNNPGHSQNQNMLFRNLGDGTYEDATEAAGLPHEDSDSTFFRATLAVISRDFNQDGWPDLYVINSHESDPHGLDEYYLNNGDGTYSDGLVTQPYIGDDAGSGMGIDSADINLDGAWDFYISDLAVQREDATPFGVLHMGNGDGTFQDNNAEEAGVPAPGTGWGVTFVDLNRDGYEELFVITDDRIYLHINNQDGTFNELEPESTNLPELIGIDAGGKGRGSSIADYDHDGDMDIAIIGEDGYLRLFRNDTPQTGCWLGVRLKATADNVNRNAIGAEIHIQAGDLSFMRQVTGGQSAHSQYELLSDFGLGDAPQADTLKVYWPGGDVTYLEDIPANQTITITQGLSDYVQEHQGEGVPLFEEGPTLDRLVTEGGVETTLLNLAEPIVIEGENMLNVSSVSIGGIEQSLGIRTENSLEISQLDEETPIGLDQELVIADPDGRTDSSTVDVAHILLNEIDVVTENSHFDFIELMTGIYDPIFLNNYVLVLFQGINSAESANLALPYAVYALDNSPDVSSDSGFFSISGPELSESADLVVGVELNFLQDGARAIALYRVQHDTFTAGVELESIPLTGLVDAIIYDTMGSGAADNLWPLMTCCTDEDDEGVITGPLLSEGDTMAEMLSLSMQRLCAVDHLNRNSASWVLNSPSFSLENDCVMDETLNEGLCLLGFESICPITTSACGMQFEEAGSCETPYFWFGSPEYENCTYEGSTGLRITEGDPISVMFQEPVYIIEGSFVDETPSESRLSFFDKDGLPIGLDVYPSGDCTVEGFEPTPFIRSFSEPATEMLITRSEGTSWLDALTIDTIID